MHAILLSFNNADLEQGYNSYLLAEGLWKNDIRFFCFVAAVTLVSLARVWNEGHQDPWVLCPQGLGWLAIALLFLWRRIVHRESGMPPWRNRLAAVSRIWLVVCISLMERRILELSNMPDSPVVSMIEGAWLNHAFQLVLVALALRLKFKWHIIVQGIMVGFMLVMDRGAFCKHVIENRSQDDIVKWEELLDQFSQRVLTAMYSRFGSPTMGIADTYHSEPCGRLSLFVHLFGGLGLVSYGVWLLERWSRSNFLKSIENDPDFMHVDKPNIYCNLVLMLFHHIPIIGIALALTWKCVTIAPDLVSELFDPLWDGMDSKVEL
ncbi:hypothetical protein BSKO_07584 [Bryopsis sp. KO-2023]|nr:hypothetical protein BSKO_07584 [Bryopsis sp. KO-2023]